jgi:hypothetical protein
VVPHLGSDDLLLERRQQALRFGNRQSQVGEIVGPLDFHDVPAPPLARRADLNQPQNPGYAFPPGPQVKDRPESARVARRPQNLRQSQSAVSTFFTFLQDTTRQDSDPLPLLTEGGHQ